MKRRDFKNRILRDGEGQRKSDGRYYYKYIDNQGKTKYVYSVKLEPRDPVPSGKRDDLSLREKIRQIKKDLNDGITPEDITVLQLVERYVGLKVGVKDTTRAGYKTVVNILQNENFGHKKIDKIKISDAKSWLIKLQKIDNRSYSSICSIKGVLKPAFRMAVDDDLIRKNPFDFPLSTVVINDSVKRQALSREDEKRFLEFIKTDEYYSRFYEPIFLLFRLGLRISELSGLTINDLDMEMRSITIDHQLQRVPNKGYIISSTKTNAGTRILPMSDEVYDCFVRILKSRKKPKVESFIDGKTRFLFLKRNNKPMVGDDWAKIFKGITGKYNSIYRKQLPVITPHVCRHTFCTRMATKLSPKTLQYWMGHSDMGVTMNVYSHVGFDEAKDEINAL